MSNIGIHFDDTHKTDFYKDSLKQLSNSGIPFLIGGAFAVFHYAGVYRDTKDLDIYCLPQDCLAILDYFDDLGYETELTEDHWLGKIFSGDGYFIDVIFGAMNRLWLVDQTWFQTAVPGTLFGQNVKVLSAEILIMGKIYVQSRERYDGADINHIWLRYGANINWVKLLKIMDEHPELLAMQMLSFLFVYPNDWRTIIPQSVFERLMKRFHGQYNEKHKNEHICKGPLIDHAQYDVDIQLWNFKPMPYEAPKRDGYRK